MSRKPRYNCCRRILAAEWNSIPLTETAIRSRPTTSVRRSSGHSSRRQGCSSGRNGADGLGHCARASISSSANGKAVFAVRSVRPHRVQALNLLADLHRLDPRATQFKPWLTIAGNRRQPSDPIWADLPGQREGPAGAPRILRKDSFSVLLESWLITVGLPGALVLATRSCHSCPWLSAV